MQKYHISLNIRHKPHWNILYKKSQILQILQPTIYQLIYIVLHVWLKIFAILLWASQINVYENYNLHFAFFIISLVKFISPLNFYKKSSWDTYVLVYLNISLSYWNHEDMVIVFHRCNFIYEVLKVVSDN